MPRKVKRSKKPKTLVKLDKLDAILKAPSKSDVPKRWKSWLHRYRFPRKYVVLMILSGLVGVVVNPLARKLIFITLARYFEKHAIFLGRMQQFLDAAIDITDKKKASVAERVARFPSLLAEHVAGVLAGNPRDVAIEDDSNKIATGIASSVKGFLGIGYSRCIAMANSAVEEIVDNNDLKDLVRADILDPRYDDRLRKYIPKPGTTFTEDAAREATLFWTVKACELDHISKTSNKGAPIAKKLLEQINTIILPRLSISR